MTKEYLSSPSHTTKETDMKKVFLIYKFANTPNEMLQSYIEQIDDRHQAHSYFKKIARMVHPDKNKHHLANEVFVKVQGALEVTAIPSRVTNCFYSRGNRSSFNNELYTACR